MPSLKWKHETIDGKLRLTIDASPPPLAARLWIAESSGADFRAASWREQPLKFTEGHIVGEITPPETGRVAFFGEVEYEIDSLRYKLSTQIRLSR